MLLCTAAVEQDILVTVLQAPYQRDPTVKTFPVNWGTANMWLDKVISQHKQDET